MRATRIVRGTKMKTIFGLFAKQPIPGKVKTRLAADIGSLAAANLYEAFLADLTDRFHGTADRRIIGYSPANDAAVRYFHDLSGGRYELWAQPNASLGDRMDAFFVNWLSTDESRLQSETSLRPETNLRSENKVVLIGSDSPTLPTALVDEAFAALDTVDAVIGPAPDGGYYLIGLRRGAPGLSDGVAWGGSHVLQQTVRNITAHNFSLHLLPPWYDVDTLDDLHGLQGHLATMRAAGETDLPPRTIRVDELVSYSALCRHGHCWTSQQWHPNS